MRNKLFLILYANPLISRHFSRLEKRLALDNDEFWSSFFTMNGSREEISFSQSQIVWNYIFLILLFIVIILNNSLVLTTALTQKRLQSQINIIALASLSTAQLVGGLLSISINIVLVKDYNTGSGFKFARVVTTFCGAATQLHLTLLCVDRCIALLDPIKYGQLKRGMSLYNFQGYALKELLMVVSGREYSH